MQTYSKTMTMDIGRAHDILNSILLTKDVSTRITLETELHGLYLPIGERIRIAKKLALYITLPTIIIE